MRDAFPICKSARSFTSRTKSSLVPGDMALWALAPLLILATQVAAETCRQHCPFNTHEWEVRCGWAGCSGCSQCTASPSPAPCMPHCPFKTHPWEEKCDWPGCAGCSECSASPPSPAPCMPHCPYRTHPWEEKCDWPGCSGCDECPPSIDDWVAYKEYFNAKAVRENIEAFNNGAPTPPPLSLPLARALR